MTFIGIFFINTHCELDIFVSANLRKTDHKKLYYFSLSPNLTICRTLNWDLLWGLFFIECI